MTENTPAACADPADPASMLRGVLGALRQSDTSLEGMSYGYSTSNVLPPSWLIQSAPTDTSCQLLEVILGRFKDIVQAAPDSPHFIDITQMGNDNPTDEFQAQMIAAFIAIAQSAQQPVVIRYLEGNPAGSTRAKDMTFINHVKNAYGDGPSSNVTVYAVSFAKPWEGLPVSNLPGSWTHAKMIAIDGQTVIAGGQNYWNDYLGRPDHVPPYDVSINLDGDAAGWAHGFANALWNYVAKVDPTSARMDHLALTLGAPDFGSNLPPTFSPGKFPPPGTGTLPVLAVGNLGMWIDGELQSLVKEAEAALANPATMQVKPQNTYTEVEQAINALLSFPFYSADMPLSKATQASSTARHLLLQQVAQNGHIRLSQQKIADTDTLNFYLPNGGKGLPWPGELMEALVWAMTERNASVDIIVSFHAEYGPYGGYSDDMGAAALYGVFVELLTRQLGDPGKAQSLASQLLTVKRTVPAIPNSSDHAESNHAKIWIVDDQVFYVGSDNVYPAYLQEFGFVIGDQPTTEQFIQNYWEPMWSKAQPPGSS